MGLVDLGKETPVRPVCTSLGTETGLRDGEIQFPDFNVGRQAGRQACQGLRELTGLRSEGQKVAITFGVCYLSLS